MDLNEKETKNEMVIIFRLIFKEEILEIEVFIWEIFLFRNK